MMINDTKHSRALAKVMRKAACLAELMTGDDLEVDLRVIREAKNAVHRIYDKDLNRLVEVPDHKTRLAAVAFSRAYGEGLPVTRQMSVTAEVQMTPEEAMERLRQSPAAMAFLERMEADSAPPRARGEELPPPTVSSEADHNPQEQNTYIQL